MIAVAAKPFALAFAAAFAIAAAGCVTTVEKVGGGIRPPDRGSDLARQSALSRTGIRTLGSIQYDGFTLPIASPDGRFLAVQTGVAPDWPTVLAARGGRPPLASSIEVWECSDTVTRVASLSRGLLLGRSADASGFLVEAPQADGSRWIGKVAWPGAIRPVEVKPLAEGDAPLVLDEPVDISKPEWLVQDGHINAFATLGPEGSLAWCVRTPEERVFRLAVRPAGSGAAFEHAAGPDESWFLPVFAGAGANASMYALRLRDGMVDLVHGTPNDLDSWDRSLAIRPLSDRADARVAWQMLAPQGTASAIGEGQDDRLVFFHPDLRRMAIWDPVDDSLALLEPESFAATLDGDTAALLAMPDGMFRQRIRPPSGSASPIPTGSDRPVRLLDRTGVPRRVESRRSTDENERPGRAWLVLRPERKSLRILRLYLLDSEPGAR